MLAGGAAAFALPWYALLTLPVLFAAGMSLLDSIDGCFMNFAYGWAFSKPVRKVYYNITITGLSVAVALIIGTIEIVSILTDKLGITSGPLAWLGGLDLNIVGFAIVGAVRADLGDRARRLAVRPHRGEVGRRSCADRVLSGRARRLISGDDRAAQHDAHRVHECVQVLARILGQHDEVGGRALGQRLRMSEPFARPPRRRRERIPR